MRRHAAVLSTAVVIMVSALAFTGCSTPSEAVVPTPTATVTPPPPPPPPNDLGEARITQIATVDCPGVITVDVARMLFQSQADAVDFLSESGQCTDIPQVLAAGENAPDFISPLQYIDESCPAGTLFTVWAHYDDDLIFGSPTIPEALDSGKCVRNLYLTGSDAGKGNRYALGREDGLRDAYDVLLGERLKWEQRTVTLVDGLTITMSRPIDEPRVTLFFLRLPDGGLDGEGFDSTKHKTLPKLLAGKIAALRMIDTGARVDLDDIGSTIAELYDTYLPETVLAHLPGSAKGTRGDHPDHQVTGDIVMRAADEGRIDRGRVIYAQGYPSEFREQNLSGEVLQRKLTAFTTYAAHDSATKCSTVEKCLKTVHFSQWLVRQYLIPHDEIVRP